MRFGNSFGALLLGLGLVVSGMVASCPAQAAFSMQDVIQQAKKLAAKPYKEPAKAPQQLLDLGYDKFQQIRFDPDQSLWHESRSNFQVMLTAPGKFFAHPVKLNLVDASGVHALPFNKQWFSWPDDFAKQVPNKLGYAGFRLTFPLNQPDTKNQFLAFAGASYFRGVARDENFGLSARGIAVNTGLPGGEEFPNFTQFWLVRPSPSAKVVEFYALLDGPSLTGAYHFVVFPGAVLRIEVRANLFVRKHTELLGLAPLTSMFFYGKNTPRPVNDWRPAVHDSDGLLIHSGTGEWLWRPLLNPLTLQMDYFTTDSPQGFGLLQRNRDFTAYEDAEARYDNRPSAWVEPHEDWGAGQVVLTQIPTDSETNDNIVAFWTPKQKPEAGQQYELNYTLSFGAPTIAQNPMAQVVATHVGSGADPGTKAATASQLYRFVVDFAGGELDDAKPDSTISAVVTGLSDTQVRQQSVHFVAPAKVWRLSIQAAPAKDKPVALRAYLKSGDKTLSETWSYALPANNRFNHAH